MMVEQAQAQGAIRAGPPRLYMELIFGAFIGMMRAHFDGRLELDDEVLELAQNACWDALSPSGRSGG